MYVRAISNIREMIFSSMVYSTVQDLNWDTKYIVYNKSMDSFELIDHRDNTPPQKIAPSKENYGLGISSATLHIDEEGVFWADCYMERPDMSYDGSIIRSLSLKWKKLEDGGGNRKVAVPYTGRTV